MQRDAEMAARALWRRGRRAHAEQAVEPLVTVLFEGSDLAALSRRLLTSLAMSLMTIYYR
jgi:hypothetical protein